MAPKTPDDALDHLKAALASGNIEFAPSDMADTLDSEIQEIFGEIRTALTGKPPKRPIWAADHATIGFVLDLDANGSVTEVSKEALVKAGGRLGINIAETDTFVDAALRLRSMRERGPRN